MISKPSSSLSSSPSIINRVRRLFTSSPRTHSSLLQRYRSRAPLIALFVLLIVIFVYLIHLAISLPAIDNTDGTSSNATEFIEIDGFDGDDSSTVHVPVNNGWQRSDILDADQKLMKKVDDDADKIVEDAYLADALLAHESPSPSTPSTPAPLRVAFAIPVGGHTRRARELDDILSTLLSGGASRTDIFVMEDVEGRAGRANDREVAQVAAKHGVAVVSSHVSRDDMPETSANFGIHLARHYKFMLDYLLVSPEAAAIGGGAGPGETLPASKVGKETAPGSYVPFDFAVFIEDDLVLAPDFVKYFVAGASVMAADPTLYCVAAHQDNAFFATSSEPTSSSSKPIELDPLNFDFRRGNHFMAPGWMTSRAIYVSSVRPNFLDVHGQYAHKDRLHLRNGHWDRFFDAMIGPRDCIYPEVPRIVHRGADGFTVDKRAQMELYSNLRLSALPIDAEYGDMNRMTREGYIASQNRFISKATPIFSLESIREHRLSSLVLLLSPVRSDRDEKWNGILNDFFGLIGVGGYGGHEGYVKVRGIFRGAVFVRWMTNLVLLVGGYSPYAGLVRAKVELPQLGMKDSSESAAPIAIQSGGCYLDQARPDRDLPFLAPAFLGVPLTPRSCLSTCLHSGYKFAGIQAAAECWCGNSFGKHGPAAPGAKGCDKTCGGSTNAASSSAAARGMKHDPINCGGDWANSVYWHATDPEYHLRVLTPPDDVVYVKGKQGQSCTDACNDENKKLKSPINTLQQSTRGVDAPAASLHCAESLFPLIHRVCPLLQSVVGCDGGCREEEDMNRGIYSPGGIAGKNGMCSLSKGRYLHCEAKVKDNDPEYRRACVCAKGEIVKTKTG